MTGAREKAAAKTRPARGVPPERVWVRMYRALAKLGPDTPAYLGLLGDCFLLRLEAGKKSAHILIDCGILLGSPAAKERMAAIAKNIVETCGGKLDLVIVTHEHWDHVSGFSHAADAFFDKEKLKIGEVWMAWTEDPDDPQAERLHLKFDRTGFALAKIGARLRETPLGADAARTELFGLDAFMGLAADAKKDGRKRLSARGVIEQLKAYNPRYLQPAEPKVGEGGDLVPVDEGTVLHTPGDVSLRAFVLGPPRDEKKLFKDKPSPNAPETYLDEPNVDGLQLMRFAEGNDPDPEHDSPFSPDYCRCKLSDIKASLAAQSPPDGEVSEFIREHYYGTAGTSAQRQAAMERRRIDNDWLGSAGAMALKLNSDTNNTSLALAFELGDAGSDVMLFPGDAQVGNWESWHDQMYKDENGRKVTAADLLARTKLYKVGHHGSHNATLKAQGLELMTHSGLVALIPTDEALGKRQGSGWLMPNPRVNAALRARTGGRILRNDRRYDGDRSADPETQGVPEALLKTLKETDLFLEIPVLEG